MKSKLQICWFYDEFFLGKKNCILNCTRLIDGGGIWIKVDDFSKSFSTSMSSRDIASIYSTSAICGCYARIPWPGSRYWWLICTYWPSFAAHAQAMAVTEGWEWRDASGVSGMFLCWSDQSEALATMDESVLLDLLECPVCLERLDASAKVLPCQHTFCRRCLQGIVGF